MYFIFCVLLPNQILHSIKLQTAYSVCIQNDLYRDSSACRVCQSDASSKRMITNPIPADDKFFSLDTTFLNKSCCTVVSCCSMSNGILLHFYMSIQQWGTIMLFRPLLLLMMMNLPVIGQGLKPLKIQRAQNVLQTSFEMRRSTLKTLALIPSCQRSWETTVFT